VAALLAEAHRTRAPAPPAAAAVASRPSTWLLAARREAVGG
jgi:hypothetical protein